MPSPIAHVSIGYIIFRMFGCWFKKVYFPERWRWFVVLSFCMALSLIPDIDAIIGIIMSDLHKYHNNMTHSLLSGAAASLFLALMFKALKILDFRKGLFLTLMSYYIHILLDYFASGRGVMLLWPMAETRCNPPVVLFRGVHWSEGFLAYDHIWTFLTELLFAASLIILFEAVGREKQKTEI